MEKKKIFNIKVKESLKLQFQLACQEADESMTRVITDCMKAKVKAWKKK